ncbi:hypothetical protein MG290_07200 [Flavobacterium sp. CBA20B-1]|uniref:hypothetical protein n=1 Tax=unclassified Flavobacterium TaxID=196869 RepID=UPI0022249E75|nr:MULTISPECIES: hypothetical protein [unclassified Flavobacterium]WCM43439.1 hypothetical protein MG290_07200 [Flavobacterium sp. CBA20B-1]
MRKFFLIIFIGFLSTNIYAQDINEKIANDSTYIKFREDAIKFYGSKEYKEELELSKTFREKMGETIGETYTRDFEEWIEQNLSRTNFSTKEAAISLYNQRKEIGARNYAEKYRIAGEFNRLANEYGYEEFLELHNKDLNETLFPMRSTKK